MRIYNLPARSLAWYRGANLAVVAGVATATAVLAGALLVGESVRASLRELALDRLGRVSATVTGETFFAEGLASAAGDSQPLIVLEGAAIHERSGRRASAIEVYGLGERGWELAGMAGPPPRGRAAMLSPALARELDGAAGEDLLLRVEKPSAIPRESLHGRKEDAAKTIRLSLGGTAPREFSLRQRQGEVRAVYVALDRFERDLGQPKRVNAIAAAGGAPGLERALRERYALADIGLKVRKLDRQDSLSVESESALLSDRVAESAAETARSLGLRAEPVLTYLANRIRTGGREIPYSLVTALDSALAPSSDDGITLNDWAARELGARPGDGVEVEYYVWKAGGQLETQSARFRVEKIVPLAGAADDRDLAPAYPGITETKSLRDWDPPFPLDLRLIRPADEHYWERYRTAPKAFVRLAAGRKLWATRFGSLTSLRVSPPSPAYEERLRAALDPARAGLTVTDVRARALEAAQGATDFGEYFVYFSFFLMVSALLLTGLFFKLGVEQRTREIGLLRAVGFSKRQVRLLFLSEGAVLAGAGAVLGSGIAAGYCGLILLGLRTWWFDAVGTRLLSLHLSVPALAAGAGAGVAAGLISIAWSLRRLDPVTPRGLLAGTTAVRPARRLALTAVAAALAALALVAAGLSGRVDHTAGFFGAGALLLTAALLFLAAWLRSGGAGHRLLWPALSVERGGRRQTTQNDRLPHRKTEAYRIVTPVGSVIALGLRSAAYRPGRSVLCIALIAAAVFIVVSLNTFRREGFAEGTGGFRLLAESPVPLIHNPGTAAGQEALGLPVLAGVNIVPFRLRPGDDASCLNLYRPHSPRILAPPPAFLRQARFPFSGAMTKTPNPWLLLEQPGDAIPAIADANSLEYALHLKVGEELQVDGVRFRIVAALRDSLFQSELLISENNFLRLYPAVAGYRFFLLDVMPAQAAEDVSARLEDALAGYGFDVRPADARLRDYHKVENTYISTLSALGALGLVLGTVGLGAVLLRNVLERRRELALLRACGYRNRHLAAMVLAENAFLLAAGLAAGTACALVAVAPAVLARGGRLPVASLLVLLGTVLAAGIAASLAATRLALRAPLLAALRSE